MYITSCTILGCTCSRRAIDAPPPHSVCLSILYIDNMIVSGVLFGCESYLLSASNISCLSPNLMFSKACFLKAIFEMCTDVCQRTGDASIGLFSLERYNQCYLLCKPIKPYLTTVMWKFIHIFLLWLYISEWNCIFGQSLIGLWKMGIPNEIYQSRCWRTVICGGLDYHLLQGIKGDITKAPQMACKFHISCFKHLLVIFAGSSQIWSLRHKETHWVCLGCWCETFTAFVHSSLLQTLFWSGHGDLHY